MPKVIRLSHITRLDVRSNPSALFAFGDNLEGWGFGGQAKEIRGEPNAIGIPTKVSPRDYLTDDHYDLWYPRALRSFRTLQLYPGVVVYPLQGVGTGLARLEARAPRLWAELQKLEKELFYGTED